jgi:hypothetical protein
MNDAYLKRKYGITLAERDAIAAEQGNKCAACGRPFDEHTRKEVDHEHFKVQTIRGSKGWYFSTRWVSGFALTKKDAIKIAKQGSLRFSVRGILCGGRYAGCNRKLGRIDNVPWLQAVLGYLQNPPARRVLRKDP